MAKTRSQNKIRPEEHKVLQPSSRKVKKNKDSSDMRIKDFKIILTRLSSENIKRIINNGTSDKIKKIEHENKENICQTNMNVIESIDIKENNSPQPINTHSEKSKRKTTNADRAAYSLRKRTETKCNPAQVVINVPKKTKEVTKLKPIISIAALFNICKQNNSTDLVVGQLVLAKMQTYSPWPSKIMEIRDKKVTVFFFGTNNHGSVKKVDCIPIQFCGPVILRLMETKQANLSKAIEEMKVMLHLAQQLIDVP